MIDDSIVLEGTFKTSEIPSRPCAGGMERSKGVSRRLKSLKDARVKVVLPPSEQEQHVDPTSWYVAEVRRHQELKCRDMLNKPEAFDYPVESYVAAQVTLGKRSSGTDALPVKEKVIIHGKIFIRVAEEHRIDVLRSCLLLTRYVKDPSRSLTKNRFTAFARVPDKQIQQLRELLKMADGPVTYDELLPQVNDTVQVIGGQLSKGTLLQDVKGVITNTNSRHYVTVILDNIGSFKFRLPLKDLVKLK